MNSRFGRDTWHEAKEPLPGLERFVDALWDVLERQADDHDDLCDLVADIETEVKAFTA